MPGKPYYDLKELKLLKEKMEYEVEKLKRYLETTESVEIKEVLEDLRNYIKEKDKQIKDFIYNNPCKKRIL